MQFKPHMAFAQPFAPVHDNARMPAFPYTPALCLGIGLGLMGLLACTPTLNWREARLGPELLASMPCKPERGSRAATWGAQRVTIEASACEAGGATFALLTADVGQAGVAGSALAQWQRATALHLRAKSEKATAFLPAGALGLAESKRIAVEGQAPDGAPIANQAAYFARGSRVYQAAVYAPTIAPEMSEPFFQALRFSP